MCFSFFLGGFGVGIDCICFDVDVDVGTGIGVDSSGDVISNSVGSFKKGVQYIFIFVTMSVFVVGSKCDVGMDLSCGFYCWDRSSHFRLI